MLEEPAGDLLVGGVHPQGEVGRQHRRCMPLRPVVRIRHGVGGCSALGLPLVRAGRALGQLPFEAEQVLEVVVAPLRGRGRPGAFQPAGDRVVALAGAEAVLPAEALLLDACTLGLRADIRARIGRAVRLAEGMPAGDQRDGLLVVHRHARERLADVAGRGDWIGLAVRPFGIDVDQAHLDGAERIIELAFAGIALVAEPGVLGAPVDVLRRLPHILAPAGETERLEAHRLQGDVAGEHDQVGPGELAAVFLLDRPQQPPRLVEVRVVRPAIEWREALRAAAGSAAAVADAVRAGAVPRHTDEERPVVTVIGRPPLLRIRHQRSQVLDDGVQVEALELLGVVERAAHRIGLGGVLVERSQVELIRPPLPVRHVRENGMDMAAGRRDGALAFACHDLSDRVLACLRSAIRG